MQKAYSFFSLHFSLRLELMGSGFESHPYVGSGVSWDFSAKHGVRRDQAPLSEPLKIKRHRFPYYSISDDSFVGRYLGCGFLPVARGF